MEKAKRIEGDGKHLSDIDCLLGYFKLRKTLSDVLDFLLRSMKNANFMAHVTKTDDFSRRDVSGIEKSLRIFLLFYLKPGTFCQIMTEERITMEWI